jgi:hypothetical protein
MTGFFITHTQVANYIYRLLYGFFNVLCATRSMSVRNGSQTSTEDFLKAFEKGGHFIHHAEAFGNNIRVA